MIEEVTIIVGGRRISGWEDVNVTLHAEAFPNSFEVALSSRTPIDATEVVAKAGDPCEVRIGDDTVITGFVDRDGAAFTPQSHSLTLTGRGRTQDLVDCSAEYGSSTIENATALDIAQRLCQAYPGLTARLAPGTDAGGRIDQLLIDLTEPAASIIQRVARNAGLLAYEDASGTLTLARAGSRVAASGASYGVNVEACSIEHAMDERFSEVACVLMSQDLLVGTNSLDDGGNLFHVERDPNVLRHRRMVIVLEQAQNAEDFTAKKAKWEVARRAGRSTLVEATVDSWRDSAGRLWEPNTLVPVKLPGLRLPDSNLVLSEVTFHRSNDRGTVADLVLMPASAFDIEPINLVPANLQGVVSVDPETAA